ncbi:MAG: hypothetical protein MUO26_02900 [Methanotrichaceae archaeon]|nr:hypothetical protein [Methanotrichaceae archaeon]
MPTKMHFAISALMLTLIWLLISSSLAQEPVEIGLVRGHFSLEDGVWRADDFGWFYYDLDEANGSEALFIDLENRTAEKGHIVYNSTVWSDHFAYKPWGSYRSIAFLGKQYLAGYPESSFANEVSSLDKGELRKVLIDTDERHTLTNNVSLPLLEGYTLVLKEASISNEEVNLVLFKNEKIVDVAVVSEGRTYVYKIGEIPIILAHVSNIMLDNEGRGFAEFDGIFQISDIPDIKMHEGSKLGNLEVTDISANGIELTNSNTLTLNRNKIVPIGGGLELIVLDDPELVYYPQGGIFDYGIHEIRGPVFTENSKVQVSFGDNPIWGEARWGSTNFSGFYFDPEKSLGIESLILHKIRDRTILPGSAQKLNNNTFVIEGLQYTSFVQPKEFDFSQWGYYFVINFLGQQWFAGYGNSTQLTKDPDPKKTYIIEHDQLGKVLIDTEMSSIAVSGNYTLAEGYELFIRDVAKDKIFINLKKDGQIVDSAVLNPNSTYIYKRDVGEVSDLPIIALHINNVFANETSRFATIDGIFQLSEKYILPIEPGTGIGKVEIIPTPSDFIGMRNDEAINLNPNSDINLWPGINIRTANNNTLRYYLYALESVIPSPRLEREIEYPKIVFSSSQANFSMTARAGDIISVLAEIVDPTGRTVSINDITAQGKGSGDIWSYFWMWNASILKLSDDNSQIMDAGSIPILALFYMNDTSPPKQVEVKFNGSGRISSIASKDDLYYISPSEYNSTKTDFTYAEMLADETNRQKYIKIEPGLSRLRFIEMDIINGTLKLDDNNHTISGSLASLEPYAERIPASPGKYELKVRIENPVNALRIWGINFDLESSNINDVSIGSGFAVAGKPFSIQVDVPTPAEKKVSISFDKKILSPKGVSGPCQTAYSWDNNAGRINIVIPEGCNSTNLTFVANNVNASTNLEVIEIEGFHPNRLINGSITIIQEEKTEAKKSDGFTLLSALISILILIFAKYRG